jgi:type I restriction enzyme S subunit
MDNLKIAPNLRFSEFNDKWDKIRLGDICSVITKGTTPSFFKEGKVTYVKIESLDGIKVNKEKCATIEESIHSKELKRSKLEEFDILFAIAGATVGKIGLVTKDLLPANTNQALAIIRLKDKNKKDFVLYALDSTFMKKYIYKSISVGAQPNLNLAQMGDFNFNIPSSLEQQKIADFLSLVDKKISLLTEKHALLEQYKKGVMQKLLSQDVRFKDENGNDFPDWQEFKLNQVVTPIKRRLEQAIKTVLTISAKKGFLLQAERFSQIIAGNSLEKYTHLKKGEFAYNRGNSKTYTYGCIYKLDNHKEALVPNIYRSFTLNRGCPEFFSQLFKNKYLDKQLRRLISSSARMDGLLNIGEKDFYEVKVPFPSEDEQKKLGTFLNELDKKSQLVAKHIEQTETFKKGLLQQMFI